MGHFPSASTGHSTPARPVPWASFHLSSEVRNIRSFLQLCLAVSDVTHIAIKKPRVTLGLQSVTQILDVLFTNDKEGSVMSLEPLSGLCHTELWARCFPRLQTFSEHSRTCSCLLSTPGVLQMTLNDTVSQTWTWPQEHEGHGEEEH